MKLTVLAIAAAVAGFGGVVRGQTHEPMPGATKGAKFTAEEIQTITNRLRGANLPAWLWSGK